MNHNSAKYGFATRAIHVGQEPESATGAVTIPIYQTSTFAQWALESQQAYDYSRSGNPTRTALEKALATLDNGTHALAFASGMAAETVTLLLLSPGDHVISGNDVYGGTYRLFTKVFANKQIKVDFVDTSAIKQITAALRPETRLIWLETPTNPSLKLCDIAAIAAIARSKNILTLVDNTFASPYFQRPLDLGADIVVYSTTKYISGHSDVVGGALVVKDEELFAQLKFLQNATGAVPGPFDSWLVLRGLKTLALRMQAHGANALALANFLANHPAIDYVWYPGLPSHPQHALAQRQMHGFGGIISFALKGGEAAAREFVTRPKLFTLAVSLGGVESLIEHPATMTHASLAGSTLAISPSLIRLSVGIEDSADLIADLDSALNF